MIFVAITSLIGALISKFIKRWWSRILSTIAGAIGVAYFFLILGDLATGNNLGIASAAIAGGGLTEIFNEFTE